MDLISNGLIIALNVDGKEMRIDIHGNFIGGGEDSAFEILKQLTGLQERLIDEFPMDGIYRQLPIRMILDREEFNDLAGYHQKSSIDIFIISCKDEFLPKLCRTAVRVEGKKGDLKMRRQDVQAKLLSKHCQVVDLHKRDCEELFKEQVNEKSVQEVKDAFKTAKVMILGVIV